MLWQVIALFLITIILTTTVDSASLTTDEHTLGTGIAESRTFGRIRRLQAMIVPVMFFLGVMKTLLAFLVAISLKSLFVGVSILMINIGLAMAKVIAFFKTKHSYEHHGHGGGGWSDKNIHVHIHNDGYVQHGSYPVEFEHPPTGLQHTAPNVFPSYGPPVLQAYSTAAHRSRSDVLSNPVYVTSTVDHEEDRYPKVLVTDRDKLDQIYAGWRQLNRKGR
ncbi:uncharacterized protein LOC131293877 [Anopheles ziemanni]|uniref:uncharacterized protein LOC131264644 n=1 Tax=Anopheles coustani TaxID=139045 RepID=UPI00265AB258|nr:uncharacterized protein LOC131264644 [Anopheles coustani]XP_058177910.1 uncharacterized protein LOC131293877 [Anopheles ziemanni]